MKLSAFFPDTCHVIPANSDILRTICDALTGVFPVGSTLFCQYPTPVTDNDKHAFAEYKADLDFGRIHGQMEHEYQRVRHSALKTMHEYLPSIFNQLDVLEEEVDNLLDAEYESSEISRKIENMRFTVLARSERIKEYIHAKLKTIGNVGEIYAENLIDYVHDLYQEIQVQFNDIHDRILVIEKKLSRRFHRTIDRRAINRQRTNKIYHYVSNDEDHHN